MRSSRLGFDNIMLSTDSYKVSHWRQYPPGTKHVYSFFESRGGRYDEVVFFGLRYYLEKLEGSVLNRRAIAEAKELYAAHFGDPSLFNEQGWLDLLKEHQGRLPIDIYAVKEGSVIPTGNVMLAVMNADPRFPWLTNWLETMLSMLWYPCTVATQSREMRKELLRWLTQTGDPALIDYKLHDFGYRGSTSQESAALGAAAHLLSFSGTDTIAGLLLARDVYGAESVAGHSIPAAEHSTITSWGRENELAAYRNMLEKFPSGLVAVVSDSYDIFRACSEFWGGELKAQVEARDGVLVVRPDSGDPATVVLNVLDRLGEKFGFAINAKGYKVLNPKVRVIQGDGINHGTMSTILYEMAKNLWSADNVAFGSGGGLLQQLNRDTQKFAFKCSAVNVNDEWRTVIKDPITDPGKRSKAGMMRLFEKDGKFETATYESITAWHDEPRRHDDRLRQVFYDGNIRTRLSSDFAQIRERVRLSTAAR